MEKIFAIGDIHGMEKLFSAMLTHVSFSEQQLILMGDLADRGKSGKQCFYKAKELVEKYGAIYLKGNHEAMFLDFLENPEQAIALYRYNGGKETLESFFFQGVLEEYSPTEIAMMLKTQHKDLVQLLKSLPLYYEWGKYLFVHAGVDLKKEHWQDSSEEDFLWIREPFHRLKNHTGRTIVFGHTVTASLHGKPRDFSIWQSDHKIGIDGGAVFGGVLHGVVFSKDGIAACFEAC